MEQSTKQTLFSEFQSELFPKKTTAPALWTKTQLAATQAPVAGPSSCSSVFVDLVP